MGRRFVAVGAVSILALVTAVSANAQVENKTQAETPAQASQQATASGQPASTPQPEASAAVVVKRKRAEVVDRIDRRIYDIKNDPDSQSGAAVDVLNKLPSVTVSPAGRLALRGDSNVTVLIDGKYPVNGNNTLQTLSAADIDRIEIITNPSAQYASDGTSGIINIITRKRHPYGLTGTLVTRLTTLGWASANGSATLTEGPWSVTGRLNVSHFEGRNRMTTDQTAPDSVHSLGRSHFTDNSLGAEVEVAYKLGDHQTLTLNGQDYPNWSLTHQSMDYTSSTRRIVRASDGKSFNDYGAIEGIYDYNNDEAGRHFTVDATHSAWSNDNHQLTSDTYSLPVVGNAVYGDHDRWRGPQDDIKADYERRYSSGNVMTVGMEWQRNGSSEAITYNDSGAIAGPHADGTRRDFAGYRTLTAAYLTYQHPLILGWTMLPGVRAEYEQLSIRSMGLRVEPDAVRLYPSLHLSHALGTGKLKLSYSRRVDRPDVSQYDPALVVDTLNASQGNPDLKPSETDSYEAGYDYTKDKVSYDATVYYRALNNQISTFSSDIGNGVILTRPVNAGHSQSGGVELTLKRPVTAKWKMSLNTNLFYRTVPLVAGGSDQSRGTFSYSGNATLEYDATGGDEFQANLSVTGRQTDIQGYTRGNSRLDLTWKHDISKTLSVVVVANDIFNTQDWTTIINTPDFKSRTFQAASDRMLRISLTRKFGAPAAK